MKLKVQRRIAADIMKVGVNRVWLDDDRLDEIKEAITKTDIRKLIGDKAIQKRPEKGTSRGRAREKHSQKKKGRSKGLGHRRGTKKTRLGKKETWMIKIRNQRSFLKELKEKGYLATSEYRKLYLRAKGGFFRSKRHIKLFIEEHNLTKKNEIKKNNSTVQKKK